MLHLSPHPANPASFCVPSLLGQAAPSKCLPLPGRPSSVSIGSTIAVGTKTAQLTDFGRVTAEAPVKGSTETSSWITSKARASWGSAREPGGELVTLKLRSQVVLWSEWLLVLSSLAWSLWLPLVATSFGLRLNLKTLCLIMAKPEIE